MNHISPKKLLHSKWTAVTPQNREKHFTIIGCTYSKPSKLELVELEAVLTGNTYEIPWRELKDSEVWKIGWC